VEPLSFFERVAALQRDGKSFAVATVVGRRAPVSAHLGDRAIVFEDGRMEGFVCGVCSREIIRQQGLEALRDRQGRLVSIEPDANRELRTEDRGLTSEHVVVPMTCASEGAVDVFVEPFLQRCSLVVVGATPVADALARLAQSLAYQVTRVVDSCDLTDVEAATAGMGMKVATLDALESIVQQNGGDSVAVVASQGHYDEAALEAILKRPSAYVGLVASRKRGATVRELLEGQNLPGLATLRSPAGLDLGARTPAEVAVSILAEIVQTAPRGTRVGPTEVHAAAASAPTPAIDPVCGMQVEIASARHTADVDGIAYYFCCSGCKAKFLKDPRAFQPRAS
jgi:xanthine dehydrogenase accessory factor